MRSEFEFSAHQVIRLRPSDQAETPQPDSCIQDKGRRKKGRIGGAEKRKGEEVNRVSCSLPGQGQGTLTNHLHQEETRDRGSQLVTTGSGPLAGKLVPKYPKWSGCQSWQRRDPTRVSICCRKRASFRAWEWALISYSTVNCPRRHTCWQSMRFYWEGAPEQRAGG